MLTLYIIGGCNGAGKTTASFTIFPEILQCREYVNADEIAKGLSPFQPENVAIDAGRLMLHRISELIEKKENFAFETTLASRCFVRTIKTARANGYVIKVIFFWLHSVELARERVLQRVTRGGHNVDQKVIERRYHAGMNNFFNLYMPVSDEWIIVDNSSVESELIAEGRADKIAKIHNSAAWNQLMKIHPNTI
jgi:predicted ABC-type ATPase